MKWGFFYSKKKTPLSFNWITINRPYPIFNLYTPNHPSWMQNNTRSSTFLYKIWYKSGSNFFIGIKQDCSYIHIDVIYENLPSLFFFFLQEKIQALQWIQITLYRLVKIRKRGFLLSFFFRILADFIHDFQLLTKSYRVPAYFVWAVHKIVKYPV